MPGTDEIDVEAVDTSVVAEPVEIRLRGPRGAMNAVGQALNLGTETILRSNRRQHHGWIACAIISGSIIEILADEIQTDELLDVPEGMGQWNSMDELSEIVDVAVLGPEELEEDKHV